MFGFDRITSDPNILGGKACIRGMRITVSLIVNLIANGMTVAEILAEYPDLEADDVEQALQAQEVLARFDQLMARMADQNAAVDEEEVAADVTAQ